MKLKKVVLLAISGNTELRRKVQEALGVSSPTMVKKLKDNSDDLTKASVLELLRSELSLQDEEILERNTELSVQN